MDTTTIKLFLEQNPEFFVEHTELLLSLKLPHPESGNLVSLHERQLVTQREKNQELEKRLREWVEFANENELLEQKMHQFTLALFKPRSLDELLALIPRILNDIFAVPYIALRLWQQTPPSIETRCFCESQPLPSCTHKAQHDTLGWFGEVTPLIHSFAYLPLSVDETSIGLLVLGSEDKNRYHPDVDKHVLHRMAQIIAVAAARFD